jgi:hypothetical protein
MTRTELMEEHQRTFDKVLKQMDVVDEVEHDFLIPYTRHDIAQKVFRRMKDERRKLSDLQFKCRSLDERLMKHVPITIKMTYNNTAI